MNTNIIKLNSFFDFFKFIADLDIDDKFNFYEFEREILGQKIKYSSKNRKNYTVSQVKKIQFDLIEHKIENRFRIFISLDVLTGNDKQSKKTSLHFKNKELNNYSEEILEKLIKIIDKFILSDEFINKKFEIYQHNKKLEEKLITKTKEKRLKI